MLTKLLNGVYVRLADVRSIAVAPIKDQIVVFIRHGEQFDMHEERVCFDSEDAAKEYRDTIARQASAEQVEEANRTIERDTRRERDRVLDRQAVLLSGMFADSANWLGNDVSQVASNTLLCIEAARKAELALAAAEAASGGS